MFIMRLTMATAFVSAYMRECVRACVHACVCTCERASACACKHWHSCNCVRVCVCLRQCITSRMCIYETGGHTGTHTTTPLTVGWHERGILHLLLPRHARNPLWNRLAFARNYCFAQILGSEEFRTTHLMVLPSLHNT